MTAPTLWTVQCGYPAYYANTVTVEAGSPEEACARAIEAANECDGWKSIDHCGSTFVDALAPGDVNSPWNSETYTSILPVPAKHREGGDAAVAARECIAFVERVAAYRRSTDRDEHGQPYQLDTSNRLDLHDALIGEAKAIRNRNKLPSASTKA